MKKRLQDVGNTLALKEYEQWAYMAKQGEEGELAWIKAVHYEFDDPANSCFLGVRSSKERIPPLLQALSPQQGEVILDVGCGDGAISYRIAKAGAQSVALDINERAMRLGSKLMKRIGISPQPIWILADGCKLPFKDESFDKVVCADVWEHLTYEQKHALLLESARVLKRRGVLVLTTPNGIRVQAGLIKWKLWAILHGVSPKHIKPAWEGQGGHIGLDTPQTFLRFLRSRLGENVRLIPTISFLRPRSREHDYWFVRILCSVCPSLSILISARLLAIWQKTKLGNIS